MSITRAGAREDQPAPRRRPGRDDGYHPLATVYQAIGLYDDVTATDADDWRSRSSRLRRAGRAPASPLDEDNIAVRAGRAADGATTASTVPRTWRSHKSIPVAGGLAGGSADAAAPWSRSTGSGTCRPPTRTCSRSPAGSAATCRSRCIGRHGARDRPRRAGRAGRPTTASWWWVVVPNAIGLSTAGGLPPSTTSSTGGAGRSRRTPAAACSSALVPTPTRGARRGAAQRPAAGRAGPAPRPAPHHGAIALEAGAYGALLSGSGPDLAWSVRRRLPTDARDRAGDARATDPVVLCAPGPVAGRARGDLCLTS